MDNSETFFTCQNRPWLKPAFSAQQKTLIERDIVSLYQNEIKGIFKKGNCQVQNTPKSAFQVNFKKSQFAF